MPSSGLSGPYPLTERTIDRIVTEISPGVYALGRSIPEKNTFRIKYVGRSDLDVNDRLHDHEETYPEFKFKYYSTPKAAFEKECRVYHDFNPEDNSIHPDRPDGTNYECPVCTIFDG